MRETTKRAGSPHPRATRGNARLAVSRSGFSGIISLMQKIVIDKPYEFVPPHRGRWWPWLLQRCVPRRLRRNYGVASVTCHHIDRLLASQAAGHGILLTPNHCRPYDPETINELCRQAGVLPYFMASWHLFMQSRLQTYIM